MVEISVEADCGNSPKMMFIKDFNIAFAEGDVEKIIDAVSNDIEWITVGMTTVNGIEKFKDYLQKIDHNQVAHLLIENIISHGSKAAASGVITMKNEQKFGFSDMYEFTSASGKKIKKITSYNIEIKQS